MSELKADNTFVFGEECLAYKKYEADKVISKLKESVKKLILDNYLKDMELRHNKYKRCLAMAMWCEERYYYLNSQENYQLTDKEYQQVIGGFWDRWHKRWLELAEKFKEVKHERGTRT